MAPTVEHQRPKPRTWGVSKKEGFGQPGGQRFTVGSVGEGAGGGPGLRGGGNLKLAGVGRARVLTVGGRPTELFLWSTAPRKIFATVFFPPTI